MTDYRPDYIVVHHSVTAPGTGQYIKGLGHYHIVLDKIPDKGEVDLYVSVPENQASPYGVAHFNSRSFSVCLVGNYETHVPSEAMLKKLIQVLVAKCKHFNISPANIVGHGYAGRALVPIHLHYSTQCPGKHVVARLDGVRRAVADYLKS